MNDDPASRLRVAGAAVPSDSVVSGLRLRLVQFPPFAQMAPEHVDAFIVASEQVRYEPDQTVVGPEDGPVRHLYLVYEGAVTGRRGLADVTADGFQYESGELFPIGALMAGRAVVASYRASMPTTCLLLAADQVKVLAAQSQPFSEFLNHRMLQLVEMSREAAQVAHASQTLAEQSLEARLADVTSKVAVSCTPDTPLADALARMHQQRLGSMLVADHDGRVQGILTLHDVLDRIALARVDLARPIREVMTQPVHSLTVDHTAQDAALLMSRHGVHHVPVTRDGRLVSIVSERDLFALQRLSLRHVSLALRSAPDADTLRGLAQDIRRFARNLVGQGVRARQLTELISHLNDVLTERLVELVAKRHGLEMSRACWLSFGSEGRSEQTISTDQDNGLIFLSDDPQRDQPAWLRFAREVNEALDACGYPLCKGNIMASNPECCLTPEQWQARFARWIDQGAPEDLLKASIYFDLRALAGNADLAVQLRDFVTERAPRVPRFLHQLAMNALSHAPPLTWLGGIDTTDLDGVATIDLKLQGTALFVDVARVYALAHGVRATNTGQRLKGMATALKVSDAEGESWIESFEFLQRQRLLRQMDLEHQRWPDKPNVVAIKSLNEIDRRILKETFRVARRLQQRMELDWSR